MRSALRISVAFAWAAAAWGPLPARATVIADWDLDTVIAHADQVVVGVVGPSRSVKDRGRVLTETEVQVERTLFGKRSASVVVSQPGGRDGAFVTEVLGTVVLDPGTEVLLILHRGRDGRRYIVGMCLGLYRVTGGELSQVVDVPLASPGGELTPAPTRRAISLAVVEAAIARRRP